MFKYGISYYVMDDDVRVPQSGLDVRLVRPGADFASGIPLIETDDSGYYECLIENEADGGFFEIWDNRGDPAGLFSGKGSTIYKLDARGLQNDCIYGNHIYAGAVTGSKIAAQAVGTSHLNPSLILPFTQVSSEKAVSTDGVGSPSAVTPPEKTDITISHLLAGTYTTLPLVFISPRCSATMWVESITLDDSRITVIIGVLNPDEVDILYSILVFPQ